MQIQRMAPGIVGQDVTIGALKKTNKELSKVLRSLSTGLRINTASDDAAGLAVSEQLRSQIRGFKMAQQNVTDATSALSIADGTGGQVSDILQRQRELALQSKNDTLTNQDRQGIDTEYQQLNAEMTRITSAAQFNGQPVASGQGLASGAAQVQAGANAGDQVSMPYVDMTAAGLSMAGTSVATSAGATAALDKINAAMSQVNTQRSTIGAMTNRFESTVTNLNVSEVNTQAAESVLRDQDMAVGLAQLTRSKILNQSGSMALSRFNEISANHLFALLK